MRHVSPMSLPSRPLPSAVAPESLRTLADEFPFLAGAWIGVALAPLAITAVILGTSVAVIDALARIVVK